MHSRVHPHEENNNLQYSDSENNIRLSQRRGAIKTLGKNKDYEKYKCCVCKTNEPYYQCQTCKLVVCIGCTINNSICKNCHDTKENEKSKDLQQGNLVWFKNTNGKFKKWCFCCMNK